MNNDVFVRKSVNSNVNLIDPNNINNNNDFPNGIPQYQDMFINVELTAKRRGRSVLYTTNSGSMTADVNNTDELVVNFMGVNQNKESNDPNYLNFTTNYYEGSTGNYDTDESFGITNVKIVTNSSYIPQVEIQFTDLRGLSFFNQKNSKYRMLFDFPPPIFELNVKGYYGMELQYKLHLVKYTTEFDSNSANFIINANFVALTYAPLTDVLFRYVVNFGILKSGNIKPSSDTTKPPLNTYDLILKLESLYSTINDKVKGSDTNIKYQNVSDKITSINDIFDMISNYENDNSFETYKPILITKKANPDIDTKPMSICSFSDYINIIEGYATSDKPDNIQDKLYLTFVLSEKKIETPETPDTPYSDLIGTYDTSLMTTQQKLLNKFRDKLLSSVESNTSLNSVGSNSIPDANVFLISKYNIKTNKESEFNNKYLGLDITDYFVSLLKIKTKSEETKSELGLEISDMINNMVVTNLGMLPTINNIFKIILDDVDDFFNQIRQTAIEAEKQNYSGETDKRFNIFGGVNSISKDFNIEDVGGKKINKIYPFPLFVEKKSGKCGAVENRIAPIKLAQENYIPEMDLVIKFIQTFTQQEQIRRLYTMRDGLIDDGSNLWIPLSPYDSKFNPEITPKSPYMFLINEIIGKEGYSSYDEIIETILKRYYVISQNTIRNKFKGGDDVSKAYIHFHARAEAINLAISLTSVKTIDNISNNLVKKYKNNLDGLYGELMKYDIEDKNEIDIGNVFESINISLDKTSKNFKGCEISSEGVIMQNFSDTPTKTIDRFNSDVSRLKKYNFIGLFKWGKSDDYYYKFTNENLIYIKDKYTLNLLTSPPGGLDICDNWDGVDLNTRYINRDVVVSRSLQFSFNYRGSKRKATDIKNNSDMIGKSDLDISQNIIYHWSYGLSYSYFRNIFTGKINKLQALIVVSNFASTLGPFNMGGPSIEIKNKNLNKCVFSVPAIIECPNFLPLYIGAILRIKNDTILYNELLTELSEPIENNLISTDKYNLNWLGQYIKADLHDFDKYLSNNDKEMFMLRFDDFYQNEYERMIELINLLIDTINNDNDGGFDNKISDSKSPYKVNKLINPKLTEGDNKFYNGIILPLIRRVNLVNYSDLTFSPTNIDELPKKYISLNEFNNEHKSNSNLFFSEFIKELDRELPDSRTRIKDEVKDFKKITEDDDIVTQTYYSFKNINDKWLSGTDNTLDGYPFTESGSLSDYFVYVDRAMNEIGDTIINAELLVDLFQDPNVSVFSVLTQILSANGFEFFPLQNFMSHTDGSWEDSFKIDTSKEPKQSSYFVCMYLGGGSSYPSDARNGFHDDGIVDITVEPLSDFSTNGCKENDNTLVTSDKSNFKYSNVFAFAVKFGEQNQSMFSDIKIDSKEYPETNESIRILSRLVGDDSEVQPIPKGQNLYSLYENRSYKATVTSLGNVMIQPTQYFQLENVPLFNGAYVILSVEHTITPNKMMTSFTGTKVLKYPIPRVTSPVAFTKFSDISMMSAGEMTKYIDVFNKYPDWTKFNSMYNHKIIDNT